MPIFRKRIPRNLLLFLGMCQIKIFLNTLSILFTICALAWHGRPVLQKYKAARGLAVKDIACAK